jgi:SAM-dependent methyltransferase
MIINDEIGKLILMQRTSCVKGDIATVYEAGCRHSCQRIDRFLPETCNRILDIGCGIGGVTLLLHQRYPNAELHMLDRDGVTEKLWYGYQGEASKYNQLTKTREFLELNGVPSAQIFTYNADSGQLPIGSFDLVVSFASMGFHYPVHTYLAPAELPQWVGVGGRLILDVRRGTEASQIKELNSLFTLTAIKKGSRKHKTYVYTHMSDEQLREFGDRAVPYMT